MKTTLEPVLEKVGRVLSEEYGIRVQCRGNRCCTDGHTIFLPSLPDDIPDDLLQAIRGYLDHESGHLAAKSDFIVGAEFRQRHGEEAFGMLNMLEDLRIEAFMAHKYPGSAINLSHAYRHIVDEVTKSMEPLPLLRQLTFAVHTRGNGLPDVPFVDTKVYAAADAIAREIRESINASNTRTVARLAESAWGKVKNMVNDPAGSVVPSTSNAKAKASSQPSGDASDGDDAPAAAMPAKSSSAKRPSQKQDKTPSPPSVGSTSGAPSINPSPNAIGPGQNGPADSDLMAGLGQQIVGAVSQYAVDHGQYRIWSAEHDTVSMPLDTATSSHAERMEPWTRYVSGVRQKLLQSLLAESRARWLPDHDEGLLNPRALHRVAAARHAPRDTADRLYQTVFRKRVIARRLDTAVTLLIDISHSMNGRRLDLAKASALVLCEALSRLNIPVSVIAFSTKQAGALLRKAAQESGIKADELEKAYRFAPLVHEVYKGFNEPFRKVSGRFESMRTHMLTPLGESMLFAARELAQRPEPRKVMMVLTDGRPTVGMDNDAVTYRHAKDSIVRIEHSGIDVVLVGIFESCVRDLHPRSVVVDCLDQLPGTVMKELRTVLSTSFTSSRRRRSQA